MRPDEDILLILSHWTTKTAFLEYFFDTWLTGTELIAALDYINERLNKSPKYGAIDVKSEPDDDTLNDDAFLAELKGM